MPHMHVKVVRLLPGEESEWMKPPYTCTGGPLCRDRPVFRCLSCGALVCAYHGALNATTPELPRPSQAPIRRGDPVTTVRDGSAIHGHVRRVNGATFGWRARNRSVDHIEIIADEHIEWARGHLDEAGRKALLAANALNRSR
jgi:hypothetical protein